MTSGALAYYARLKIRRVLSRLQGGICPICGEPFPTHEARAPRAIRSSVDHVIPRSLGGIDQLGNLLIAHVECNAQKGSQRPTGCTMIWLLAINSRLGLKPDRW